MQLEPQRVRLAAQPLVHPYPPAGRSEQSGVLPPHCVPHAPQLVASVRSVSQPLVGLESQSPNPSTQLVPHCTPSQVALALVCDGHGVQAVAPHDVTALFETHAPPHK